MPPKAAVPKKQSSAKHDEAGKNADAKIAKKDAKTTENEDKTIEKDAPSTEKDAPSTEKDAPSTEKDVDHDNVSKKDMDIELYSNGFDIERYEALI